MLSFTDMLLAPITVASSKESMRGKKSHAKSRETIKANSRDRYRLIMEGNKLTTGDIASRRGITHMGCLSTLYEMEKEGLIERLGMKDSTGSRQTVVWGWK